ncbi:p-loop containing nucleoside triphosphate hydrolase [Fusarium sporotrichioides]|uniref:p-loop containing nucleoside triphosphate hydrolase n=1 Tax=Fusarium sporotrichioides TaxID=5514 RepID=A0A395RVY9_FUSSP|nr:p-loop containing nucleoside triphosphate hydrolase [Fusarium sporotrichioides]
MASPVLKRPALGQIATLGSLYDARSDTFLPLSFFSKPLPADAVKSTKCPSPETRIISGDTLTDKFDGCGIDGELGVSVLAELAKVEGSGLYLSHELDTNYAVQSSLLYDNRTVKEELNLSAGGFKECVAHNVLDTATATHVVTDRTQAFEKLEAQLSILKTAVLSAVVDTNFDPTGDETELVVFGDNLANAPFSTNFADLQNVIEKLPSDAKGQPIFYTLMPLSLIDAFGILDIETDITYCPLGVDCAQRCVQIFDDIRDASQRLSGYFARLQGQNVQTIAEPQFACLVREARNGKASNQELWTRLKDLTGDHSPYNMYNQYNEAFVLYFNEDVRHTSDAWADNLAAFLDILEDQSYEKLAIAVDQEAVDNDAHGTFLEKPYISHLRRGRVVSEDLVESRKILAANCVMRVVEDALDRYLNSKPPDRRAVKIPCPHYGCDQKLLCNWICGSCQAAVEYGVVDNLLYCDCGASIYYKWEFQCNDPRHGSGWHRYKREELLELLKALEPFEDLNILILGETGVGKSTWINAFINYLSHESIDDALESENFKWAIPCSFQTQTVVEGRFVETDIKIGSSQSEKDGSGGQSATQSTKVYTVDIGKTRVRLIDTPGIGDTRGVNQDNSNMNDILSVLRTYDNLHGVLILLKPNAARLTVMFRFCIKQLLTHLHRNAANNIVFGFTNTRGSNYKPGNTFKPLNSLLAQYKDVKMGLFENNVYCFDSESFRYLAAKKKGIDIGHLEDNRRSWEYSVGECERLVKYCQCITPHQVRSTINLNETRNTIHRLTEPMTAIAEKIRASIDVNEDAIKELQEFELTRKELQQRLFVQRESLMSVKVERPQTVCTHDDCVEIRTDLEGTTEATTVYKTVCHEGCFLISVDRNRKGHPELQSCFVMGQNGICKCNHSWMDHMHIHYKYVPTMTQHRDKAIDEDLSKNANKIQLREEAIRMKKEAIEEFKLEHWQIQEAAIQFGFFLQRHAITPYNDATVEYHDILIDQERQKMKVGGSNRRHRKLKKEKAEYLENVEVLEKAMKHGDESRLLDDSGVAQLVDSLYGLPQFGGDLRNIVNIQERAADATYRERSYNVTGGARFRRRQEARTEDEHLVGSPSVPMKTISSFEPIPGSFPREPTGDTVRTERRARSIAQSEQRKRGFWTTVKSFMQF